MRLLDSAFETDWAIALRQARKRRGLQQNYIAEKLGVHRASLCQWETGVSAPSTFDLWNRWSELVGFPPIISSPPEMDCDDDAD